MSITKADIVELVYKKGEVSKKEADKLVEMIFETIKASLAKGEAVKIPGLGSFSISDKSSRIGRNPRTGGAMEITPRRVLTFKSAKTLKEDITARYAHRIDEKGIENKSIPEKGVPLRSLNSNLDEIDE